MKKKWTRLLSVLLAVVLTLSVLPASVLAIGWQDLWNLWNPWTDTTEPAEDTTDIAPQSGSVDSKYKFNILFLDCGRKYYSVDSIEQIIDNGAAAGFNYIQLAVGNDGLRFLLDDMSLTVNDTVYASDDIKNAINSGNNTYNSGVSYYPTTNALNQFEMDSIIAYANSKDMGVIPCINTPGHMDAILSAATSLTGTDCSYNGSVRTIDVTNSTAVDFTKALLQKYLTYFAGKGCKYFNMGADEYANDKYTTGSMGFGNLVNSRKYSYYITYVNGLNTLIKNAGMTAMAFNDGFYFNGNTYSGTLDKDILVCYWSSGWGGYEPMSASNLASMGYQLINTHGDYYYVLGKKDAYSTGKDGTAGTFNGTEAAYAAALKFDANAFYGSTVSAPAGSMLCIWADYPGVESESTVVSQTASVISGFGAALPAKPAAELPGLTITSENRQPLTVNGTTRLTASVTANWSVDKTGVVELASADAVASYALGEVTRRKSP